MKYATFCVLQVDEDSSWHVASHFVMLYDLRNKKHRLILEYAISQFEVKTTVLQLSFEEARRIYKSAVFPSAIRLFSVLFRFWPNTSEAVILTKRRVLHDDRRRVGVPRNSWHLCQQGQNDIIILNSPLFTVHPCPLPAPARFL